jgi:hypothetical protein
VPLATDANQVEPIWRRVAARAGAEALPPVTTDPSLRLVAGGHARRPVMVADDRHVFVLPPGQNTVRITSRAAAPADLRPWLDDRRRLGVPVARIVLRGRHDETVIHPDDPSLVHGWHQPESANRALWRWTDGDAVLPVPTDTIMLEIHLVCSAEYPTTAQITGSDPIAEQRPSIPDMRRRA